MCIRINVCTKIVCLFFGSSYPLSGSLERLKIKVEIKISDGLLTATNVIYFILFNLFLSSNSGGSFPRLYSADIWTITIASLKTAFSATNMRFLTATVGIGCCSEKTLCDITIKTMI